MPASTGVPKESPAWTVITMSAASSGLNILWRMVLFSPGADGYLISPTYDVQGLPVTRPKGAIYPARFRSPRNQTRAGHVMAESEAQLKAWMLGGLDGDDGAHAALLRALVPLLLSFYRRRMR